jgi:uncharacterized damage-inducible protein DinB
MSIYQTLWAQHRNFLEGNLKKLKEESKDRRLNPDTASLGFLCLHVVEAIHLIASMVLDQPLTVPLTIGMGDKDDGREINIEKVYEVLASADKVMDTVFSTFSDEKWVERVQTPFGEISRAEGLGFLMYHTAYHIGQIALTYKRGS